MEGIASTGVAVARCKARLSRDGDLARMQRIHRARGFQPCVVIMQSHAPAPDYVAAPRRSHAEAKSSQLSHVRNLINSMYLQDRWITALIPPLPMPSNMVPASTSRWHSFTVSGGAFRRFHRIPAAKDLPETARCSQQQGSMHVCHSRPWNNLKFTKIPPTPALAGSGRLGTDHAPVSNPGC